MVRTLSIFCLIALASISVCAGVVSWEAYKVGEQLHGRTGVLARFEGIESQAFVISKNAKQITGDVREATGAWKAQSQEELAFIHDTLPQLRAKAFSTADAAQDTLGAGKIAIATLAEQERAVGPLLASAKAATDQLPPALADLHIAVGGVRPLLDSSRQAADDFDELLASKDLAGAIANTNAFTGNMASASGDFKTRFHQLLYPDPCRRWACVGRYAWPVVRDGASFAESLYWTKGLFTSMPGGSLPAAAKKEAKDGSAKGIH